MVPFSKYSGAGNDFILIDRRIHPFPLDQPLLVRRLCHRQLGIGADGLLLIDHSPIASAQMRIFNSDGSEAEMCGNGLRCFAKELLREGESCEIEVSGLLYHAKRVGEQIATSMPSPLSIEWALRVEGIGSVDFLNTGVPHAICFVDELDPVAVAELGRAIRTHPCFAPAGTNVNFVQLDETGELSIRTYERGVEAETLACGTGAVAAALAAAHRTGRSTGPTRVRFRSGDSLIVDFQQESHTFKNLTTQGPAQRVYEGQVDLNSAMG